MNAKDLGYKFKVLKGYIFEGSELIFKDFIIDLYKIKSTHTKDHPMYLISKLLMNSLYGRFGMHEETFFTKNDIVNNKKLIEMMEDNNILDVMHLGEDNHLITYIPNKKDNNYDSLFNNITSLNISISLSAAITAYARIHMYQFKKSNNDYNLLYSDTDSIAIDRPLPDNMIGKELGCSPSCGAHTLKLKNRSAPLRSLRDWKALPLRCRRQSREYFSAGGRVIFTI